MSEFEGSSFHNNTGKRIITLEEDELINWDDFNGGDIEIYKAFLRLSLVEDLIWEKISCKLVKPSRDIHADECICCQVQHMTKKNVYALRRELREIHITINNDLKVLTTTFGDVARLFL
ncbi:hypothetical protein Tco_0566860 [Tanacetum coccineum]